MSFRPVQVYRGHTTNQDRNARLNILLVAATASTLTRAPQVSVDVNGTKAYRRNPWAQPTSKDITSLFKDADSSSLAEVWDAHVIAESKVLQHIQSQIDNPKTRIPKSYWERKLAMAMDESARLEGEIKTAMRGRSKHSDPIKERALKKLNESLGRHLRYMERVAGTKQSSCIEDSKRAPLASLSFEGLCRKVEAEQGVIRKHRPINFDRLAKTCFVDPKASSSIAIHLLPEGVHSDSVSSIHPGRLKHFSDEQIFSVNMIVDRQLSSVLEQLCAEADGDGRLCWESKLTVLRNQANIIYTELKEAKFGMDPLYFEQYEPSIERARKFLASKLYLLKRCEKSGGRVERISEGSEEYEDREFESDEEFVQSSNERKQSESSFEEMYRQYESSARSGFIQPPTSEGTKVTDFTMTRLVDPACEVVQVRGLLPAHIEADLKQAVSHMEHLSDEQVLYLNMLVDNRVRELLDIRITELESIPESVERKVARDGWHDIATALYTQALFFRRMLGRPEESSGDLMREFRTALMRKLRMLEEIDQFERQIMAKQRSRNRPKIPWVVVFMKLLK
eukprot:Blabericola_migrator_1__6300@NODE_317_length_9889_cov_67_793016_g258_i0_p3_GENE_NODE_317_length_9889_cov_67_793016_g258_i0NODE_317_length_9889_cov_67_793016_g258_i0_p3_ORF_typecomplete_len566_score87_47_NODE_317_length_9889_cov_67_793016_g258_i079419638